MVPEAALAPAAVTVSAALVEYLQRVPAASRGWSDLLLGASPRAGIWLLRAAKARAALWARS